MTTSSGSPSNPVPSTAGMNLYQNCRAGYGAGTGRPPVTRPSISMKVTPLRVIEPCTWPSSSRVSAMSASFFGSPNRSRLIAIACSRSIGMSSGYSPGSPSSSASTAK